MLSTAERYLSSDLLRTAYRAVCQPMGMSIADALRKARAIKGWSQRELAKRMKVAASAVAQWESGTTKPKVANRTDLSKMLGIPFLHLMPEISISRDVTEDDQELLALVQQLLELPRPVRTGLLMTAAATAEAIRDQSAP